MHRLLRILFVLLIARPVALLLLGLNVRDRARLPLTGPAIVAANHNSHLDTLALLSLFPLRMIHRVHPVAAADYFMRHRWLGWCVQHMLGIVPVERNPKLGDDPLVACHAALARGEILIVFPEGTRGAPEIPQRLKSGVAHLLMHCPEASVTPVYMYGLGRAMPKGEPLLVPHFCDIWVDMPLRWPGDKRALMRALKARFDVLRAQSGEPDDHSGEPHEHDPTSGA